MPFVAGVVYIDHIEVILRRADWPVDDAGEMGGGVRARRGAVLRRRR
jgi:hypothetical protein